MKTNYSQLRMTLGLCIILAICLEEQMIEARVHDRCMNKPSTSGVCGPSTLGIYYDVETQHCFYMGCTGKRLFETLEHCEKICNNQRHIKRRNRLKANETTN